MSYFYILLLLAIIIVGFFPTPIIEGYESWRTCIDQGYPSNFCLHVPAEAVIGQ